ncbi:DNA-binding domain-containing protein [Maliponia aquimaris]|uniref:DNA-binding domain-containing protein n=1 Tax=Maliponia aquimaris TaxID=1673631 RepID=UPI0015961AD1|nr:DNA-binding domain-containing protein [Maliponia aquimaris]
MIVRVSNICGLAGVPSDKTAAFAWLDRQGIKTTSRKVQGGQAEHVSISDLPEKVRRAYWRRELDRLHLDQGQFDDAAHAVFMEAPAKARARAERKALIAATLTGLRARGLKGKELFAVVRQKFGKDGTSDKDLMRVERRVKGVDPINYAPALLDNYKPTAKHAEFSEEAWRFFLTMIRDAAPDWPLKEAWRRVRDAGRVTGWSVPSYATFFRRWKELSEAQRMHARHGRDETAKRLSIPAQRDRRRSCRLSWFPWTGARSISGWTGATARRRGP